jgi:hypothetical protein
LNPHKNKYLSPYRASSLVQRNHPVPYSVIIGNSPLPPGIKRLELKFELMHHSSYRGAANSLARPTSRCILFDGENISFDASLVIYINIYI